MYTLYYSPGACSMAVHALLNELNQPVKLEAAKDASGKPTAEMLKVNPRGAVPVLVDDGHVIREGGAIIAYLCDKHQSDLLPKSGKERATALEWLMFANSTLHPAYGKVFGLMKSGLPESDAKTQINTLYIEAINKLWKEVDAILAKQKYIAGETITAADILLTVIANWGLSFKPSIVLGDNVKRMVKDVSQRPSFQKALKDETVEYKAAA